MICTANLIAIDEVTVHVVQLGVASPHVTPETNAGLLT